MSQSDESIFRENLEMWNRPCDKKKRPPIIKLSDDVERIVDEMFERFCEMPVEEHNRFIGNA